MKRILTVLRQVLDDKGAVREQGHQHRGFLYKLSWIYCSEEGAWTCISYLSCFKRWVKENRLRVVFRKLFHCSVLTLSSDTAVPLVGPSLGTAPVAVGTFRSQQKHLKSWGSQFGITGFNAGGLKSCFGSEPWKHPDTMGQWQKPPSPCDGRFVQCPLIKFCQSHSQNQDSSLKTSVLKWKSSHQNKRTKLYPL